MSENTKTQFILLMWAYPGAIKDGKIVQPARPIAKGASGGQTRGGPRSVGASKTGVPEETREETVCRPADMQAETAMPGVKIGDVVYYMLQCQKWSLISYKTGKSVPLQMLPDRENTNGVLTWIKNLGGIDMVYPSTNDLGQMPGLFTRACGC